MAKRSRKKETRQAGISPSGASWVPGTWLKGFFLALAVVLVYQPVWYAGFIWDDDDHLTANPAIVGPGSFKDIWTTSTADIAPLTRSTFWLEHKLWGLSPLPYHVVNVLLQAACAILLWQVLKKLSIPGAWFGAALWALHPVQVESVAWITEMKNTESGVFFLLSISFFIDWLRRPGRWRYGLTLIFAALAMAGKSSTVILPVAFCLCAWWVQGRWRWRNMMTVVPVFVMSIAASALSIWTQRLHLSEFLAPQPVRTLPERLIAAGDAAWFYLSKLLWPHPLLTVYPRWSVATSEWFLYLPLLAMIAALGVLWIRRDSWSRPVFFALAWFLTALLPVLGLFDNTIFRYSPVFDHFQYLASMGPLALAGAGIARISEHNRARSLTGACVLLLLGMLTWQRAWAYQSQQTLWTATLNASPECWLCHSMLGDLALRDGQIDDAIGHLQRAVEINPSHVEDANSLGIALAQKGRLDEAIERYQAALRIAPGYAKAHYNLGSALLQQGQLDESIAQFRRALELNPGYAGVHNDLGIAFARKGRTRDALGEFEEALKIDPDSAEVHCNLANTLAQEGHTDQAIPHFQRALDINPNYAEAHNGLGYCLAKRGQIQEAIVHFREALRLNPEYRSAQENLASVEADGK